MTKNLREQIIEEAAARIDAASTYEEQICEYKHAVAELMLRTPYLEILSNPRRYFVPGTKVDVHLSSYARRGEPSPTGVGTILAVEEIQFAKAKVLCYLVKFDDPDRWSDVWLPDWPRDERQDRYNELVEALKEQYSSDRVGDRCGCDIFVKCPQQWVPHNYCDFAALAPGMEWPEYVIS